MSKRFSESTRWEDPWYRALKPALKNFWDFLCMRSDAAGVWKPDWEDIKFRVGAKIDQEVALNAINEGKNRINVLSNGYWQVLGLVEFQCGAVLQEKVGAHRSAAIFISKYREFGYTGAQHEELESWKLFEKIRLNPPDKVIPLIKETEELEDAPKINKQPKSFKYFENQEFVKAFKGYLEMRKKQRKIPTELATELVLEKLHKYPVNDAIKMLNNSIEGSWTSLYPLKDEKGHVSPTTEKKNEREIWKKFADKECSNCRGEGCVYAQGTGKFCKCSCVKQ